MKWSIATDLTRFLLISLFKKCFLLLVVVPFKIQYIERNRNKLVIFKVRSHDMLLVNRIQKYNYCCVLEFILKPRKTNEMNDWVSTIRRCTCHFKSFRLLSVICRKGSRLWQIAPLRTSIIDIGHPRMIFFVMIDY